MVKINFEKIIPLFKANQIQKVGSEKYKKGRNKMKKSIVCILICALIFSFTACQSNRNSNSISSTPSQSKKEVELTTQNIEEYLIISGRYGKIDRRSSAAQS